jgi:hypothetical protein
MLYIYILELENNKYYIGKTTNPQFRLEQHFNSTGSSWTQKYKPIKLLEIIHNCDIFDEDKYTLKYMSLHGIDNVRGGSFCEIKLNHNYINILKRMIDGASDKCYKCREHGHFANECNKSDISTSSRISKSLCSFENIWNVMTICKNTMYNLINNIYNTKTPEILLNDPLPKDPLTEDYSYEEIKSFNCCYCNMEFDTVLELNKHETIHVKPKNKSYKCFRCKRWGHYAINCNAFTDVNGKYLDFI